MSGAADFEPGEALSAAMVAVVLSVYGYSRRSLSASGAVAALMIGFLTFYASFAFGMLLIAFFLTSSRATKVDSRRKAEIEADHKEGGHRNWVQVLCNSVLATAAALDHRFGVPGGPAAALPYPLGAHGARATFCAAAVLGHYACCNGDTWASELGVLAAGSPRLITTWRRVPPGTNGGVSLWGTLASLAGGLVIGVTAWLVSAADAPGGAALGPAAHVLIGCAAGIGGSAVDSLLGATVQFSGVRESDRRQVARPGPGVKHVSGYNVIGNHAVNFFSTAVAAAASGFAAVWLTGEEW